MVLTREITGDIACLTIDNPPVNALSAALRKALKDEVAALDAMPEIKAVILACAGRTFIAGADISEFGKPPIEPHLPDVILAIEGAQKPWIAVLHGSALGGGFEVALACHYRLIDPKGKIGLPETSLGVIPGAGGTVRTPRLIDVAAAIDMITTAKPMSASQALATGAVDAIIDGEDRLAFAQAFARKVISQDLPTPLSQREISGDQLDADFWQMQEKKVRKAAKGSQAPLKALASIKNATETDFASAMAFERQTFLACRESDESSALRHVFFAERGVFSASPKVDFQPIQSVAIVGGGTMGAGIIVAMQQAGCQVTLIERDQASLERGIANVEKLYQGSVKRQKMSEAKMAEQMSALKAQIGYENLADIDLALEAAFEDLSVKQDIFTQLDAACSEKAILATNTSYLDPNKMADVTKRADRFIGLHFFSPAHIMKLLEIIKTASVSDQTVAASFELAKRLKKMPVLAGVCDGFIGNRILKRYRKQAELMLVAGATPSIVDRAMTSFGFAMGPFAAQDLGGLDIAYAQRQSQIPRVVAPVADPLCEMKRFGQKTGGGWYDYKEGDRTPYESDIVAGIIKTARETADIAAIDITETFCQQAILYPMIDEAIQILQEKIALRPADVDLVEILGFGFPRWRGGLLHYAETVGLAEIHDQLVKMADLGLTSAPCQMLIDAVAENKKLSDFC